MAWREILVFADGSADGLVRMRMALDLAEAHGARLEALVLTPVADGNVEHAGAVEKLSALAPGRGDRLYVHSLQVATGDAVAAAAREARCAELVVLGQPETLDNSDLDTDIFVGALTGGGRPVLMLPRWISPRAYGRRILIAWRGSPEAARALHASLPFLRTAEAVRVCLANPRSEEHGEDERSMAELASMLTRQGVKVEDPVIRESWEAAERMIVSELEGFNADMLVMGAYSRSRMLEDIFGGMTAQMVRDVKTPILLMH